MSYSKKAKSLFKRLSPIYRKQEYSVDILLEQTTMVNRLSEKIDNLEEKVLDHNRSLEDMSNVISQVNSNAQEQASVIERIHRNLMLSIDIENLPQAKGAIRDIQLLSNEGLKVLDRICKKHNLEYWLDFGTLLGAVRHKGFIPWDDDTDIGMMSADYKKLLVVIDEELADTDFRFIRVPSQIGKIVHKDFMPHGNDEVTRFINWDISDKIMFAIDVTPYYFVKDSISNESLIKQVVSSVEQKQNAQYKGGLLYDNFLPAEAVVNKLHSRITTQSQSKRLIMGLECIAVKINTRPWIVSSTDLFPLSTLIFENNTYRVPHKYQKYLINAYGEYMNIPQNIDKHIRLSMMPKEELNKLSSKTARL